MILYPKNKERLDLLARRWSSLPDDLKTPDQALGRYSMGCGATHGIYERCDFGCTACYLGANANRQKPMPFEDVYAQFKALRAYLGPTGNVQITSGEVTLLPVEDLIRIVRAAIDLELSPMVMSHGDVFLEDPRYLERLVKEGGLRKLSLHVDMTQRGRTGISRPRSEKELNTVRDRMAALLLETKKKTGIRLRAATTLTVNEENLSQLDTVIHWFLENLDAFRMISFQPQAQTGRTKRNNGASAAEVWLKLEKTLDKTLNPHPIAMGHPSCNRMAFLIAVEMGKRRHIIELVRAGHERDRRIADLFLKECAGVLFNGRSTLSSLRAILGLFLKKPKLLVEMTTFTLARLWSERRSWIGVAGALLTGRLRIRPFAVVVHAFMSAHELSSDEGKQRLEACAFKVPVDGRMVSMCEMNGTELRESTYREEAWQV